MKNIEIRGEIFLFITSIIWGTAFVAQRVGMELIGPFTFTSARFFVGTLSLLVLIIISDRLGGKDKKTPCPGSKRDLILGGVSCGLALFGGISFQQVGLQYTTAGKAGFITALYILLVPLLGLFLKKKVNRSTWLGVGIAIVGLYLLCVTEGFKIARGDFIVLCGTLFWAVHILIIDHFAPKTDGLKMSFIQFFVAGSISTIVAFFAETVDFSAILKSAGPILYAGVIVVGIAFTLQIFGQRNTNPTAGAIILSMESVFAVISGMILIGEVMSSREIVGCVLMFAAVILTEVKPFNKPSNSKSQLDAKSA